MLTATLNLILREVEFFPFKLVASFPALTLQREAKPSGEEVGGLVPVQRGAVV